LAAGVALVWLVDPRDQTVTIYRADAAPELVNVRQGLTGDPHLAGFHVAVGEIFA
jgi:Uma2 family endonuclease